MNFTPICVNYGGKRLWDGFNISLVVVSRLGKLCPGQIVGPDDIARGQLIACGFTGNGVRKLFSSHWQLRVKIISGKLRPPLGETGPPSLTTGLDWLMCWPCRRGCRRRGSGCGWRHDRRWRCIQLQLCRGEPRHAEATVFAALDLLAAATARQGGFRPSAIPPVAVALPREAQSRRARTRTARRFRSWLCCCICG